MNARCQICGRETFEWTVRQLLIDGGSLQNWKVQACEGCTKEVTTAVVGAIAHLRSGQIAKQCVAREGGPK